MKRLLEAGVSTSPLCRTYACCNVRVSTVTLAAGHHSTTMLDLLAAFVASMTQNSTATPHRDLPDIYGVEKPPVPIPLETFH